jgi:hypothetical protein
VLINIRKATVANEGAGTRSLSHIEKLVMVTSATTKTIMPWRAWFTDCKWDSDRQGHQGYHGQLM